MILLDEIRGRLSEVFSLKTYKIGNKYSPLIIFYFSFPPPKDHVVHGAIASICTYGALMGANPE